MLQFFLLQKIRNYLLLDISCKCKDIASFTKYIELSEYFRVFNNMFESDYTLNDFLNSSCTNRQIEKKEEVTVNIVNDFSKISHIFLTSDFKMGVTIIENGAWKNLQLSNFKQFCNPVYSKILYI